ncbi:MAG: restriction endonuclease, partial [Deltaproteobacteria bacterium]|nr:restriction endonuclease [Deltaproteobacteria bacterium]
MTQYETLGKLIKNSRLSLGLCKAHVAKRASLAWKTIQRVEAGKSVSDLTLHKLSMALKINYDDLLVAKSPPSIALAAFMVEVESVSKEIIRYIAKHPDFIHSLTPRKFEYLIAEILIDMGAEIELTPETRDGGRDILAAFNTPIGKILTLVECKKLSADRKVGIDIVERFLWTIEHKDRATCGLIATTSYFSSGAIKLQDSYRWKLKLKDFD